MVLVLALGSTDSLGGLLHGLANELADAPVIENRWHSATRNENRDAVAKHKGIGMIDLKAVPADQFDRKRLKRLASLGGT
jgi:hypothetical protein